MREKQMCGFQSSLINLTKRADVLSDETFPILRMGYWKWKEGKDRGKWDVRRKEKWREVREN